MRSAKVGGWYRSRGYSHLDHPISYIAAKKLVTDPNRVSKHSFLPLIGFTDQKRQFKTDNSDLTVPRKKRSKIVKIKKRELRYASHRDSAIYSYYAFKLQRKYDDFLKQNNIDNSVIGYRSGLGSNIDLAADAFEEISCRGKVTALCFDIKNFFPTISHKALKKSLEKVLNVDKLSDDWYAVYRNVCKYAYIDLEDLAKTEGFNSKSVPFPLVDKIPNAMKRARTNKTIQPNNSEIGIPQGTAISAVFANISMLEFDLAVNKWALKNNASYRRYSDDIMLLVAPKLRSVAQSMIDKNIKKPSLEINANKTEISEFSNNTNRQTCDTPITYLGFTYDGLQVSLRSRTISRFYRRMTYASRGAIRAAGKSGITAKDIYKRKLYKDFTHLGKRNFYSYAKRADSKFSNSVAKKQLRKHYQILQRKLDNRGK